MLSIRRIAQTLAVAGAVLVSASVSRVAWAQNTYNSTYFDTAPDLLYPVGGPPKANLDPILPTHGTNLIDNRIKLVNPSFHGTIGSPQNLCAMIYVYDDDEQPIACCGCPMSSDSELQLSVIKNLTPKAFGGGTPTKGTIHIISANTNSGNDCDPTGKAGAIVPAATIRSWITHLPVENVGTYPTVGVGSNPIANVAEVEFLATTLTTAGPASQLEELTADCGFIRGNGSGRGVCSCTPEDLDPVIPAVPVDSPTKPIFG